MPHAFGLVCLKPAWHLLRVRAHLRPGYGAMHFSGITGPELKNTIIATVNAVADLSNYMDVSDVFATNDLYLGMEVPSVPSCAVVGESYGLPLAIAVLGAVFHLPIPQNTIFTGCLGPAGEVLPVERISDKRLAARNLGFNKIMLPGSQLDMMNTTIHQFPVHNIREAFSVTFFGEENV